METATSSGVRLDVDGAIARIVLDQPEEENRLTEPVLRRLAAIAENLRHSGDIHAVVIRGQGTEIFSTCVLNPALRGSLAKEEILRLVFLANEVFDAVEALPQMVIAGINGLIRAGAVELALACDMRVAAAHAKLSMPEARWGGFPGAGGPVRLPAIVGYGRAAELICTGREIDAEEMLRIGLVERVAAGADFDRVLDDLAVSVATSGPLATRGAKQIMRVRSAAGFGAARKLSDALRRALEYSDDVDESIRAHREGRRPKFTGR